MSAVAFMLLAGWVLVALLLGMVIGSAIRCADEHEQPTRADEYTPTEVWL